MTFEIFKKFTNHFDVGIPSLPFEKNLIDDTRLLSAEEALAVSQKTTFYISDRQFAHRLVPAYLGESKIVGMDSLWSVQHWIQLISLWVDHQCLFLELGIAKQDLEYLLSILKEYEKLLQKYQQSTPNNCEEAAAELLDEAKKGLAAYKHAFYIPVGYAAGVNNRGHALPLKLVNRSAQVEGMFLTVGDGLHMHPQLGWSGPTEQDHFQSFPVLIPKKELFSQKGIAVFERLVRLYVEPCVASVQGYGADDVYSPFYSLGTIQSVYQTKVAEYAHKPQLGNICGDMAVVLLIKDILIDLGIEKEVRQRFFCLEKLCDILFFHVRCKTNNSSLDDWILLKNGVQEFSVHTIKSCESILRKEELHLIHHLQKTIYQDVLEHIEKLHEKSLSLSPIEKIEEAPPTIFPLENTPFVKEVNRLNVPPSHKKSNAYVVPKLGASISPTEIKNTLYSWLEVAHELISAQEKQKAHTFVYKALLTLEIPTREKGFWDEVPLNEMDSIIELLSSLAQLGFCPKTDKELKYRNIFIFTIGYAIVDKLLRRKFPTYFEGFASPFFPSSKRLVCYSAFGDSFTPTMLVKKEQFFEFRLLPLKALNSQWVTLCAYFEENLRKSKYLLFALGQEEIDISQGVKDLKNKANLIEEWSPTKQHLKFLEAFLEKSFPKENDSELPLEEKFARLWLNKNNQYLPKEIETLYFFAHFAERLCRCNLNEIPEPIVPRNPNVHEGNYTISIPLTKASFNEYEESSLDVDSYLSSRYIREKFSENETQCILHYEGSGWGKKAFLEWGRIFSNPIMQISSIIQWMRQNVLLFHTKRIQSCIQFGLFEPGFLERRIIEAPQTLDQLRSVILHGIEHYLSATIEFKSVLFLVHLGICVETFAKAPRQETVAFYEKVLLQGLEKGAYHSEIYATLLFLYQVALPSGEHSLSELIKGYFWLSYHEKDHEIPNWLYEEIAAPMQIHLSEIQKGCQNKEWVEKICSDLFKLVLPEEAPPIEECGGEFPCLKWGKYQFHLESALLSRTNQTLLYFKKAYREKFPFLPQSGLVWEEKGDLFSSSGHLKIEMTKETEGFVVSKQFPQLKEPSMWYYKTTAPSSLFASSPLMEKYFDHWVCHHQFVICAPGKDQPLYMGLKSENGLKLHKLLPNGDLGPVLLPLHDKKNHKLHAWFNRFGNMSEVCVWFNEKTKQIQEIDFLILGLSFIGEECEGSQRFRSKEYPDYFLAREQMLPELNNFEGCIVLENSKQKSVLIPTRVFSRTDLNFSSTIAFQSDFCIKSKHFFFYLFDSISREFIHPSDDANFFLSLLFAEVRDFQKALHYLSRAKTFTFLESYREPSSILDAFKELNDDSPEALAFYLRLGMHLMENASQMIAKGYESNREKIKEVHLKFYKWVGRKYKKYLRILSNKEICRVPAYIRLSLQEERHLLRFLQSVLQGEDQKAIKALLGDIPILNNQLVDRFVKANLPNPYWREEFEIRLELIEKGRASLMIYPRLYSLFPSNLLSTELSAARWFLENPPSFSMPSHSLKGFVRVTDTEVKQHFIPLYQKIKKGEAEMDLFFVERSIKNAQSSLCPYATLLRYIQKHPKEFAHLNFSESDSAINEKVFEEIVQKATGLMSILWQGADILKKVYWGDTVFFRYLKSSEFSLPLPPQLEPIKWHFSEEKRHALKEMCFRQYGYFTTTFLALSQEAYFDKETSFALEANCFSPTTYTEKELVDTLRTSYQKLLDPKFGKTVYRLKANAPGLLSVALSSQLESKRKEILDLKKKAEKIANAYPDVSYRIGLRKIGKDLPEIRIEGILTQAYLAKDPMLLKKANPTLAAHQVHELLFFTIHYHVLRIQIFQLEKAVKAMKINDIQGVGEALFSHGDFDPIEEPELFVYQSKSGKIFRPSQAELFSWEVKTSHVMPRKRLFSITAGEGKTTLYKPIEMKRLNRLGYAPISISPKPLYLVDREGLKESSERFFSFDVHVCELALSTQTKPHHFEWLFEEIEKRMNGGGLKLIPETFYALHLKYQLALEEKDENTVKWISKIFHLFETKGAALIDECRINCSPFTQAKIGIGKPLPLPCIDRQVMIEIYKVLASHTVLTKQGRPIAEVVRLEQNFQATLSKEERKEVKEAVFSTLVDHSLFQIPPSEKKNILTFWLGERNEPLWLQKIAPTEEARGIHLVKIVFDTFFKTAMKLVWRMKHVRSLKENEEIHVPAKTRQATKAYFEEVYLTLMATIQGTLQEGLTQEQTEKCFKELEHKHFEEVGKSSKLSEIEKQMREWTQQKSLRLSYFSTSNNESMKRFHQLIKKNKEAIFWYLEHAVTKQVVFSPQQLTVTPVHLMEAFKCLTLFSAEPGHDEIYGIYEKGPHVRRDSLFLSHVLHQFAAPHNRQLLTFPILSTPLEFFRFLKEQDSEIYKDLRMIVDAGGMLRDFITEDIISDFFKWMASDGVGLFDGIIIFEESSTQETETKLLIQLKDWDEHKEVQGHDIESALESMGCDWKKLKLLTFIDSAHRAGANIEQPKGSSVLVLLGEELTLSDNAQGGLRGRGVLKKEQKIIWGASQKLLQSIEKTNAKDSLEKTFGWEAKNDAKISDKETLLSAYQQIDYFIAEPVLKQLKQAWDDPFEQIALWYRYRGGFVKQNNVDPLLRFKGKKTTQDEKALWAYAEEAYKLFGYSQPWAKNLELHKKIKPVVETVKKRQIAITSSQSFDASRHAYMHSHQKEEIKKEQVAAQFFDLKAEKAARLPFGLSLAKENFLDQFLPYTTAVQELFGSTSLTKTLRFSHNAIHTAKSRNISLKENYLKPANYVLFVEKEKKICAFALSDGEAAVFKEQLIHFKSPFFRVALLGWDGSLVQNGQNEAGFLDEEFQTPAFIDPLIDVGLTRCELLFPIRFRERVETWHDFWPMWNKMKQSQMIAQEVRVTQVEKFVPDRLEKKPIAEEKKKSYSLFSFLK